MRNIHLSSRHALLQQLGASFLLPLSVHSSTQTTTKRRILLDADTANEVGDLWAIVCAFYEPLLQIEALSSAQWTTTP